MNYIKFSCIIFCHDIFYCSQYILFTKLKYFWSGDISNIRSVITAWNIKTRKFIMIFFKNYTKCLCAKTFSYFLYVIHKKNRRILDMRVLRQNILKIRQEKRFETITSLYMLNCFDYFQAQCFKSSQRFWTISSPHS